MIYSPIVLTPEQAHTRGTLRAAVVNAVQLLRVLPENHPLRPRAEQLADEAAQALVEFWQDTEETES